jgi:cell wall-associated NlpC family hydrolase
MSYKLLSLISFSSVLTGCGGILVQPPAPIATEYPAPEAQAPRSAERSSHAPASNSELIFQVLTSLGIDYRNGGRSPKSGFDCSGLVAHVYQTAFGIRLPHNTLAQSNAGIPLERRELAPGDLVFYNTLNRPYSHVGIYLGDGRFVHAPKSGAQVRVESMQTRYWAERYNGARRIESSL